MKYLLRFDENSEDKLPGLKIVGKINLDYNYAIRNIRNENFEDEVKQKVEAYFKSNPKITDCEAYTNTRIENLLDHAGVPGGDPRKKLIPFPIRAASPKGRALLDNKIFFRYEKKFNCYTAIKAFFNKNSWRLVFSMLYGPIKSKKHGDFYFIKTDNKNVYEVFTKHFFKRFYEREIMNSDIDGPPLNDKQLSESIKEFMNNWFNTTNEYEYIPNICKVGNDILFKFSKGASLGETNGDVNIHCTYYPDRFLKDKHLKDMEAMVKRREM